MKIKRDEDDNHEEVITKTTIKTTKKNKPKRKRRSSRKKENKSQEEIKINKDLAINLVKLEKVMTHLAEKTDKLTDNMAELIGLFEGAALSFAKKQNSGELEKDKEFLDKLNILADQNKTIAKGLTLMEEKLRKKLFGEDPKHQEPPQQYQQPQMQFQQMPIMAPTSQPMPSIEMPPTFQNQANSYQPPAGAKTQEINNQQNQQRFPPQPQ